MIYEEAARLHLLRCANALHPDEARALDEALAAHPDWCEALCGLDAAASAWRRVRDGAHPAPELRGAVLAAVAHRRARRRIVRILAPAFAAACAVLLAIVPLSMRDESAIVQPKVPAQMVDIVFGDEAFDDAELDAVLSAALSSTPMEEILPAPDRSEVILTAIDGLSEWADATFINTAF